MKTAKQFLEEALSDSFKSGKKEPSDEYHVILVDGKRVELSSKKSIWKKIGHAKTAMNSHIHMVECEKFSYGSADNRIGWETLKQARKQWIEDHCEFITLQEWKKRGCP